MSDLLNKSNVTSLLTNLRKTDKQFKNFGANAHQYELQPPIQVSIVDAFEAKHHIALPGDYRHFITEIGNGGAGPYYGLFPFGYQDDLRGFCKWENGGMVGDFASEFPHRDKWNLPKSFWDKMPDPGPEVSEKDEDRMMEAWDQELNEHYWHTSIMNGAIPICHLGCAYRQWLVINGPQKGYIWSDDRVDYKGVYPLRDEEDQQVTFRDWYMSWLRKPLRV